MPALAPLLDVTADHLSGCLFSIRVSDPSHGACVRLVVSPHRHDKGILHMSCGQSGNPLSPHYPDQHPLWAAGLPLPLIPGQSYP